MFSFSGVRRSSNALNSLTETCRNQKPLKVPIWKALIILNDSSVGELHPSNWFLYFQVLNCLLFSRFQFWIQKSKSIDLDPELPIDLLKESYENLPNWVRLFLLWCILNKQFVIREFWTEILKGTNRFSTLCEVYSRKEREECGSTELLQFSGLKTNKMNEPLNGPFFT